MWVIERWETDPGMITVRCHGDLGTDEQHVRGPRGRASSKRVSSGGPQRKEISVVSCHFNSAALGYLSY